MVVLIALFRDQSSTCKFVPLAGSIALLLVCASAHYVTVVYAWNLLSDRLLFLIGFDSD